MVNIISLIIFKRIKYWLKNFSFLAGSGGNCQEMTVVCGIKFFFFIFCSDDSNLQGRNEKIRTS